MPAPPEAMPSRDRLHHTTMLPAAFTYCTLNTKRGTHCSLHLLQASLPCHVPVLQQVRYVLQSAVAPMVAAAAMTQLHRLPHNDHVAHQQPQPPPMVAPRCSYPPCRSPNLCNHYASIPSQPPCPPTSSAACPVANKPVPPALRWVENVDCQPQRRTNCGPSTIPTLPEPSPNQVEIYFCTHLPG